jgi:hypothetical protein
MVAGLPSEFMAGFRRNSQFVRWDQLRAAIDDRRGSLVFSTTDNRKLGGRALLLFPTGNYVSARCQTRDGVKLVSHFPALWQGMTSTSDR